MTSEVEDQQGAAGGRDQRPGAVDDETYAVVGLVALLLLVPSLRRIGESSAEHPRRIDLSGLVLLAAAATLVVSALTQGRDGVDGAAVVLGLLAAAAAVLFVVVAGGQLLGLGLSAGSNPWRLLVPMVVAGLGTGVLNALLGREAVASVPPDRAAMGSGANNTARYLGAACGITLFVVVATHAGSTLLAGWNVAVLVSTALTLLGAGAISWSGRRGAGSSSRAA